MELGGKHGSREEFRTIIRQFGEYERENSYCPEILPSDHGENGHGALKNFQKV